MQNLEFAFKTYLGGQNLEIGDSFLHGKNFFVLAEGIGGEYLSEVARETACKVIYDSFFKHLSKKFSPGNAIISAIQEANAKLIKEKEKLGKKMAASVIVVYIKENIMYFTHLGDSRLYTISGDKINQLTRDHTVLEEDPESIKRFGNPRLMRALTNGLGIHEDPEITVKKYRLHNKDLIIMTSEGLTRRITDRDILWNSQKTKSPKHLCDDLLALASKKGGSNGGGDITIGILKLGRLPREMKRIFMIYLVFFLLILIFTGSYFLRYKKDGTENIQDENISQTGEKQGIEEFNRPIDIKKDSSMGSHDKRPEIGSEIRKEENNESFGAILDFIEEWKFAWEMTAGNEGDMETYIAFYSRKFRTSRFDKEGWRKDKARKNGRKKWIRVELTDIKISGPDKDGRVEVRFFQEYQSSNYSSKGGKLLILVKEMNGWKINSERGY